MEAENISPELTRRINRVTRESRITWTDIQAKATEFVTILGMSYGRALGLVISNQERLIAAQLEASADPVHVFENELENQSSQ